MMLFYRIMRGLAAFVARSVVRVRVRGLENVPDTGACVIAANHIHALDPLLLAIVVRRPICFMAKEELLRVPVFGWLVRRVGVFPVKRGKVDVQAIRHSLEVLAKGGALGIFPEGTRSKTGEIQEALGGAAMLSARGGAVLIPAAIDGEYRIGGSLRLCIGQPVAFSSATPGKLTGDERSLVTKVLMERIAELRRQCLDESW